ncbi:MAG: L-threonylcarbamoyladenylate synthase [Thermodesulfovibrionales bacterium]|nr:L-threonylcarbamoyladenylate synthase [Thermodesulfovibrionales bacterium]
MLLTLTDKNYKEALIHASKILNKGGIISYPTETFYAIGARYDKDEALDRIFQIKKRPEEKSLTLIIGKEEQLKLITSHISHLAKELIKLYWPGPLTLVFKAKDTLSPHLKLNNTVAVRIPGSSFALDLARFIDFPITATSANISNMPPARDASTVFNYFNEELDLIIDGGLTPGNLPSTIVDVTEDKVKLVRKGAIDISKVFL